MTGAKVNFHERTNIFLAFCFGLLIGTLAGLIGVGGGEFRIPVLLYVLGLPVATAIAVNLLVGLLTVVVSSLRRLNLEILDARIANVVLYMSIGSMAGSYLGALLTERIPERSLRTALATLLIVVGIKIILEPFTPTQPSFSFSLGFFYEAFLATLSGFMIGVISGSLGVAGGEFRIPLLIYAFGLDVVIAGTTSLLISIPTVAMGFKKHHQMGNIDRKATAVAVVMGVGSVLGAVVGASYVAAIDKGVLKMLLGAVLMLATIRMITKP